MPKIPDYREQTNLRVNNPTGIAGSSDERIIGDSIAGLGDGMQRFGSALAEFNAAANKAKTQRTREIYGESSEMAHLQLADEARKFSNPDGTDLIPAYIKASRKWEEEEANKIEDPEERQLFQLSVAKSRNDRLGELYGVARTMQKQTNENAYKESLNMTAALASSDPGRASVYLQRVRDKITTRVQNGALNAEDAPKAYGEAGRLVADAAVGEMVRRKDWMGARQALVTTFAGVYDSEARNKAYELIDRSEVNFAKAKYQEEKRQREEEKRFLEERSEANRAMLMQQFSAAKNPAEKRAVAEQADWLRQSNSLSREAFNEVMARQKARLEGKSTEVYQRLRSDLERGKIGIKSLRDKVSKAWDAQELTEDDGTRLYGIADQMEREAKAGFSYSQQATQARQMIDRLTKPDGPQGIALKAMGISDPAGLGLQMKDRLNSEMLRRPGVSPYQIGKELIKDQFPAERTRKLIPPVPGLPAANQDDVQWLDGEGRRTLIRLYKMRKLDEPSFKKHMEMLNNRVNVLPALEN